MDKETDQRTALERRRRARLFDLIRQQDQAGSTGVVHHEVGVTPSFARHFQDRAAKSLGQRAADRVLSNNLRRR